MLQSWRFYHKIVDGMDIYAVSLSSPQEKEKFCVLGDVKDNLSFRTGNCDRVANGRPYVLVIPYGIYENEDRDRLNEDCFLKPIEWLQKEKGYKVYPWYLRKSRTTKQAQKDALARKVCMDEITTTPEDYNKSSVLEKIVKRLIAERELSPES